MNDGNYTSQAYTCTFIIHAVFHFAFSQPTSVTSYFPKIVAKLQG